MPFPMKIQPIDAKGMVRSEPAKPVGKSRLKRLFERQFQFPAVLRISSAEKLAAAAAGDPEPSSVCLDKMVQSFMEDNSSEKPSRCGRHRCNCFHGNCDERSDDDADFPGGDPSPLIPTSSDAAEVVKGLVLCTSVAERNLLADASNIMENFTKMGRGKEDSRRAVADGLRALGYDAAVCKSRWEKCPSFPAGEYEYVDVIVAGGERLLVDVDFRSEFEIARSTKTYRVVLQSLPSVFVGKEDRLQQIVSVACEAARQSLKKKGLHFPPWRKLEYMRAKWLSPFERTAPIIPPERTQRSDGQGEVEARRESEDGKKNDNSCDGGTIGSTSAIQFSGEAEEPVAIAEAAMAEEERVTVVVSSWEPPAVNPKAAQRGAKVVPGLSSVLRDEP
ncbi:uncharacterized protein LOC103695641 [Phoenix dactylifera]|uniref:Uncharacterized protein LOC103695641 n=1 Tax=Phoenix dactylifera TaxID=42345 RepID=A0A8B7BEZ1_PHODC|nr:uncharacterized protein LOC103695641 [Phoenix dactylifera]